MKRKTLFVIMPFGVKQLRDGREHNFDTFYNQVLRPVADREGWQVRRADELVEPGIVTHQAMRHLYSADLVLADVSAPNSNVYYELGVRQAVSPGGTILVAVRDTELPFDIRSQRILFYDRDFAADRTFQDNYRRALGLETGHSENPVQAALGVLGIAANPREDLASFEREFDWKIDRARTDAQLVAVWHWAKQFSPLPSSGALSLAGRLARVEDYATAAAVLAATYPAADTDYEVHRQRGYYLRKFGDHDGAVQELQRALELNPNDPQTLGMLGGAYKRQQHYDLALEAYERGVHLAPNSLYLRVARAGLMLVTSPAKVDDGVTQYREIVTWISETPSFVGNYWADLVLAEAWFVLGDFAQAREHGHNAVRNGAHPVEVQSTTDQIKMLGAAGHHLEEAETFAEWLADLAKKGARGELALARRTAANPKNAQPYVIFHISDTHFGSMVQGGRELTMHRFYESENSERLAVELVAEFTRALTVTRCQSQDATVVLSGDLTYGATPAEFDQVEVFLRELCAEMGFGHEQIVLVPGNHDVDWTVAKTNPERRFDNYLGFVRRFYGDDLFRQLYPLVTWNFEVASQRNEPNQIIYLRKAEPVTFIGLNSCIFEDHQHHYGFIGRRQLERVRRLLPEPGRGEIRAAVMHHQLHPYPELLEARSGGDVLIDMTTVRDAGLVEQRLANLGVSLVMHGHKHKPQLRETSVLTTTGNNDGQRSGSLFVSGCGSTGVSEHALEHSTSNHYAIVELLRRTRETSADFIRVEWRELSLAAGAEWATSGRWSLKG